MFPPIGCFRVLDGEEQDVAGPAQGEGDFREAVPEIAEFLKHDSASVEVRQRHLILRVRQVAS